MLRIPKWIAPLAAALLFSLPSAEAAEKEVGWVDNVDGTVMVLRGDSPKALAPGDALYEQDTITTDAGGSVGILFEDGTAMSLGPNSKVSVDEYRYDAATRGGSFLADMKSGTMVMKTGQLTKTAPGSVRVKTPRVIMGVRGTTFAVWVDKDQSKQQ